MKLLTQPLHRPTSIGINDKFENIRMMFIWAFWGEHLYSNLTRKIRNKWNYFGVNSR